MYVLPHAMPAACFIVVYCTYIYIQCNFFYPAMALMNFEPLLFSLATEFSVLKLQVHNSLMCNSIVTLKII